MKKARDVKPGDLLQVPWQDDPIRINYIGPGKLTGLMFKGSERYLGYWDPDDMVPIVEEVL